MSLNDAKLCFKQPEVMSDHFIPDHVFMLVTRGTVTGYDGNKSYTLSRGEYCIVRKNRLAKYSYEKGGEAFERIIFCFDEPYLRDFKERHKIATSKFYPDDTFIEVKTSEVISEFIRSLKPYCDDSGKLDPAFEDVKYEELLIILLQNQSELAGLFFDFGSPQKINLEEFMNRNYKFNVSMPKFAFLTGRSLSTFKRDFKAIFNETPNRWLIQNRLNEAYFLINNQNKKATEIYLDLGFEDLSHFSISFKKQFGMRPTEINKNKKAAKS